MTKTDLVELQLTYEQLYNLYGKGDHEVPFHVTDELYVRTPTGFTRINEVVAKHNNEVIHLDFDDGDSFECSVGHLFQDHQTGSPVDALNATEISSLNGKKTIVERSPIGHEKVYDISIESPHWYISNLDSGIVHHNTFYALAIVKNFLENNPDGYCLYFDTESAITKNLLSSRGIDLNRVIILNVVTIEEFRTKALKAVELYLKKPIDDQKPCMFVLDSLGMLSTNKEINDTLAEKDTRDMTKAQLIKGAFRMLTLKLGQANIPMFVTNHVYSSMSMYSTTEISGGSGLIYSASSIIELSKSKEKEGTEVVGAIIRAKTRKSRLSKENQDVETRLFYDERGLDRYYGLPDLAAEAGIWPCKAGRYEIDGTKYFEKQILKEPERFFTDEIMSQIDEYCKMIFSYGS